MMSIECPGRQKFLSYLPACWPLLSLAGCTTPEKAKAEHVSRGEAFLKAESIRKPSSNSATPNRSTKSSRPLTGAWRAPMKACSALRRC